MHKINIEVSGEIEKKLDFLAKSFGVSEEDLALKAVENFISYEDWKEKEVLQAISEANSNQFSSPEEVLELMKKWKNV